MFLVVRFLGGCVWKKVRLVPRLDNFCLRGHIPKGSRHLVKYSATNKLKNPTRICNLISVVWRV